RKDSPHNGQTAGRRIFAAVRLGGAGVARLEPGLRDLREADVVQTNRTGGGSCSGHSSQRLLELFARYRRVALVAGRIPRHDARAVDAAAGLQFASATSR